MSESYACPLCEGLLELVEGPENCDGKHEHARCPRCNHEGVVFCLKHPEKLARHQMKS